MNNKVTKCYISDISSEGSVHQIRYRGICYFADVINCDNIFCNWLGGSEFGISH